MAPERIIHPDFLFYLEFKPQDLITTYRDLRALVLSIYPDCNELLYNTHALTSVYSLSEKLSDAFCMIPIYSNHLNLGFNKGTLLNDHEKMLVGTGKLIRHIPIQSKLDVEQKQVKKLLLEAVRFALSKQKSPSKSIGMTISKIKS